MGDKFIPNGDVDFETLANHFARTLADDPGRFGVTGADAEGLSLAAGAYRLALHAARSAARSPATTRAKEDARAAVERIVRRLAMVIRANDEVDGAAKVALGLRERSGKPKQRPCPAEPPEVRFVRAVHEANGAVPRHELAFRERLARSTRRPAGAARLELFVDLLHPDEPIPDHPGANHGGRPWYLRSFTRSPIVLVPPMTRVPMRVVYWGRWADSMGNVGPFSATAVAWIEGGMSQLSPNLPGTPRRPELMAERAALPAGREQTINVLVLEAQYQSFVGQPRVEATPRLEGQSGRELRQLAGQGSEAAAA